MAYRDDPPELATRRRGAHLPLLDRVTVATPCTERWDDMVGDARVRHCRVCDQQVFNTVAMTTAEVEVLLVAVVEGQRVCGRIFRRSDGTIITADCVDARTRRRKRVRQLIAAATAALAGLGAVIAVAPSAAPGSDAAPATASSSGPRTGSVGSLVLDERPVATTGPPRPAFPPRPAVPRRRPAPPPRRPTPDVDAVDLLPNGGLGHDPVDGWFGTLAVAPRRR